MYVVFLTLCCLLLTFTAPSFGRTTKKPPENDVLNVGADFTALCPDPKHVRDKNNNCYDPNQVEDWE